MDISGKKRNGRHLRGKGIIVGVLIGIALLYTSMVVNPKTKKLEDLALGEGTTSVLADVNNTPIHCNDLDDAHRCLDGYRKSGIDSDVLLWLGNSQVHAINRMKQGDVTAVPKLHKLLTKHGHYFLTFSQPNANLQEHYLLFQYLLNELPISTLVLPVVFDDMRENGIRTSLTAAMNESDVVRRLAETPIGEQLLANYDTHNVIGKDTAALENTVQEKVEIWFNDKLASIWPVWEQRANYRGKLFLSLYQFRNWVLGINPSSTRRMIPGNYALNRQAVMGILNDAKSLNIPVLLYIVPLRNDVKVPYDLSEYQAFKKEMELLAKKEGAYFADLESLVPAELWGTKGATTIGGGQELDFMHFQAGGHELLAKALYAELVILWEKESQ